MDPLHARYPFFGGARDAVREADISPAELIAEDAPAVERGLERVERALMEGTVEAEEPSRWDEREELLSYPIARILVSLVDTPAAVAKYAAAEAATARARFLRDFEADDDDLQSTRTRRASLDGVLSEFGLSDDVRPERDDDAPRGRDPTHYWVALGSYLTLQDADWGERWRLVNREVADGEVRVTRDELHRTLEEAVRRRVAEGLPFEVRGSPAGEEIADALEEEVSKLRDLLNDHDAAGSAAVETVVPALFPPCMKTLVRRVREGEAVAPHSEFSLVSFLVALGMDETEVTTLLNADDEDAERLETRVAYLADADGSQFAPPTCATLKAYGDCTDPDERCETISHPLSYYESAVRDAGDVRDWRETVAESE
ncbi:DNA primase [Halopelagius longus]|nr:DNA primase [Halopelagius longus]RDI73057.1 DNA primase [Halopelagius longus]